MLLQKIVTTSWDDGDPRDMRLADCLRTRALPGTFYVPMKRKSKRTLDACDLKALIFDGFEIGAHTISHRSLAALSRSERAYEIGACKHVLEQALGNQVSMFCYPNGSYNADVIQCVRSSGYSGARTTRMLSMAMQFRPFEMPTTLQAYPHPKSNYISNLGKAQNASGLFDYFTRLSRFNNWVQLGQFLFDRVREKGGIWHLYGHSWEIEELDLWDELTELLDYVSRHDDIIYLNNGQLMSLLNTSQARN